MSSFEIVEPRSVEEAFGCLAGDDPAIRPFAGGTALMLMIKAQVFRPVRLVSLCALDGCQGVWNLYLCGRPARRFAPVAQLDRAPDFQSSIDMTKSPMRPPKNR